MDRRHIMKVMKAEKADTLSAFEDYCGITAYEERLSRCFGETCADRIRPGQEIVLWGCIGQAGTVYLAESCREQLRKTLPEHFIRSGEALADRIHLVPEPDELLRHGVIAAYQIAEGGLLNGLCRLATDSRTGFRIDYEAVPVNQVTIEFCEIFDWNPWQLLSGGCVLAVTEHGFETVTALGSREVPCRVIGCISDDQDKLICHGEIRSCLNRPQPDELLKILGKPGGNG